ncbi:hypothetical protein AV530_005667 [Patagioenas fasciata monilis]|uniref:Uncharacterized protein n=1 Tax=Patagioenas fasciata monilis TaxID=372326 RepID=A0A1V4JMA1_PATFA|nr:hypothetical protein AV530_005667 [Patagioenas fasciata monilis]
MSKKEGKYLVLTTQAWLLNAWIFQQYWIPEDVIRARWKNAAPCMQPHLCQTVGSGNRVRCAKGHTHEDREAGNNFKHADHILTSHQCFRVSSKSSFRQKNSQGIYSHKELAQLTTSRIK